MPAGLPLSDEEVRREFMELIKAQTETLDKLTDVADGLASHLSQATKESKRQSKKGNGGAGGGKTTSADAGDSSSKNSSSVSLDPDSINNLAKSIGLHVQTALNSIESGGEGGKKDEKQSGADSAQQTRFNQTLDAKLGARMKGLLDEMNKEVTRLVSSRINEAISNKIVGPMSQYFSGGIFLDKLNERMSLGADAAQRNMGGVVDAFTNNIGSIITGANDFGRTMNALNRNLSNGGTALSTFRGDVKDFGTGLRRVKQDIQKGTKIDRNLNSEQQNDYLSGLYDQQVRMGIRNRLDSNEMRQSAVTQLKVFQRIATNTGRTVEEIINQNRQGALPKTVEEIVARMGIGGAQADQMRTTLSAYSDQQIQAITALGIDLSQFGKDLYASGGNTNFATGRQINAVSEENKFSAQMLLSQFGDGFADAFSGRVDDRKAQQAFSQSADRLSNQLKGMGGVGFLMTPNVDFGSLNTGKEQAEKYATATDQNKGYIEGIKNWFDRRMESMPWIGEMIGVTSGIWGTARGIEEITKALGVSTEKNTSATKQNTLALMANMLSMNKGFGMFSKFGNLFKGGGLLRAGATGSGVMSTGAGLAGKVALGGLGAAGGLLGMLLSNMNIAKKRKESFFGTGEGEGGIMGSKGVSYLGSTASGALAGAAIGSVVPVIGTMIGGIVGGAVGLITAFVTDHWDSVKKLAGKGWEKMKQGVSGFYTMHRAMSKFLMNGMTYMLRNYSNGIVSFVEKVTGQKFDNLKFDMKDSFTSTLTRQTPPIVNRPAVQNPAQARQQQQFRSRQESLVEAIKNDGRSSVNGYSDAKLIEELRSSRQLNAEMLKALQTISRNTKGAPGYDTAV